MMVVVVMVVMLLLLLLMMMMMLVVVVMMHVNDNDPGSRACFAMLARMMASSGLHDSCLPL